MGLAWKGKATRLGAPNGRHCRRKRDPAATRLKRTVILT
jgi:hypothetical protein